MSQRVTMSADKSPNPSTDSVTHGEMAEAGGIGKGFPETTPAQLLLLTMLAAFVTEAGVMALLAVLPHLDTGAEAFVDSTFLTVLLFPVLYLTIFRPMLREIEARKSIERELHASRALLAEAQEVAHVGHWSLPLDSDLIAWSDEAMRLFGVETESMVGELEAMLQHVHFEDRLTLQEAIVAARKEGDGFIVEHRIVLPDGRERVVISQGKVGPPTARGGGHVICVVRDVTEQRAAQLALERSHAELDRRVTERTAELAATAEALRRERNFVDTVVDTAGALVVVLNRDAEVVRFNQACERASGYTFEEMQGKRFWDMVIPDEERAAVQDAFAQLCAGQFPEQLDNRWVTKDGSRRFISWSNTALCDDRGEVEFVIGTGVDVTERHLAEEALRRSEERNRTILRTAQDGFWVIDESGWLLDVNDAYCELVGYDRDELIGHHVSLVEVHENEDEVKRHVRRVTAVGSDRFETRHRCKDGSIVDVEVSVTYLPFGEGQLVTFLRDVTARKRDAAELERRRAELEAIIDSTGDAIVFTDTSRRIALTNPAFSRMFGYGNAEVLGRDTHFLDVAGRDHLDGPGGSDGWDEVGAQRTFEIQCRRKDGSTLWVETQAVEVKDERGSLLGYVAVHRDVSERRSAEAQIRASLKEKDVLLKEIHHRVKNNLQVIASMLNLQADQLRDEAALAPLRESKNRIRSLALIHEKLYRSEHIANIDFHDYVSDLAQSIVSSVNRSATPIEVETRIDDVRFNIDTAIPVALIVNELVSNSVKHAFDGRHHGRIVVELQVMGRSTYELTVSDDGVGFPADLDPAQSATLGLQLVDVLATQLGGSVKMSHEEGARVVVSFVASAAGGSE